MDAVELVRVDERVRNIRACEEERELDGDARLADAGGAADDADVDGAQSASK
jgi:hypothetical protein